MSICLDTILQRDGKTTDRQTDRKTERQTDRQKWQNNISLCMLTILTRDKQDR